MARNRILIVEDLASVAMSYAGHLERAGYESVIVDSGAAVLDALADGTRFDALLLDLQLPDVDGLQLLRDHPEILRRCPIIVATADASLSRAIDAMRLGAFDFLVKPVAGSRLATVSGARSKPARNRWKRREPQTGTTHRAIVRASSSAIPHRCARYIDRSNVSPAAAPPCS